jgi:hypothetical protein
MRKKKKSKEGKGKRRQKLTSIVVLGENIEVNIHGHPGVTVYHKSSTAPNSMRDGGIIQVRGELSQNIKEIATSTKRTNRLPIRIKFTLEGSLRKQGWNEPNERRKTISSKRREGIVKDKIFTTREKESSKRRFERLGNCKPKGAREATHYTRE